MWPFNVEPRASPKEGPPTPGGNHPGCVVEKRKFFGPFPPIRLLTRPLGLSKRHSLFNQKRATFALWVPPINQGPIKLTPVGPLGGTEFLNKGPPAFLIKGQFKGIPGPSRSLNFFGMACPGNPHFPPGRDLGLLPLPLIQMTNRTKWTIFNTIPYYRESGRVPRSGPALFPDVRAFLGLFLTNWSPGKGFQKGLAVV